MVAVVDCYHAANPNTIAQQIEGGVIFGLSAVLYGEITIKDGAPVQSNFNNYPLLRMTEDAEDRGAHPTVRRQDLGRHRRALGGAPSPRPSATPSSPPPASGCASCR